MLKTLLTHLNAFWMPFWKLFKAFFGKSWREVFHMCSTCSSDSVRSNSRRKIRGKIPITPPIFRTNFQGKSPFENGLTPGHDRFHPSSARTSKIGSKCWKSLGVQRKTDVAPEIPMIFYFYNDFLYFSFFELFFFSDTPPFKGIARGVQFVVAPGHRY